jgi:uncharacterized LabA/DUF88 family protein
MRHLKRRNQSLCRFNSHRNVKQKILSSVSFRPKGFSKEDELHLNGRAERVIVYIDAFNLRIAIEEAGLNQYKWLNIEKLVNSLLQPYQTLVDIKYFTSVITCNHNQKMRQLQYHKSLNDTNVHIIYGNYKWESIPCNKCDSHFHYMKEKMTDVNIATSIIVDAFKGKFDTAILISGDTDLVPPINEVHRLFNNKRVLIAFPPNRQNTLMAFASKGSVTIGKKKIINAKFDFNRFKLTA